MTEKRTPPEITTDLDKYWLIEITFDDGTKISDSIRADTPEQAKSWAEYQMAELQDDFFDPAKKQGFTVEVMEKETQFLDDLISRFAAELDVMNGSLFEEDEDV